MIVTTGDAGSIGNNVVKPPNDKGIIDILVVDSPKDSTRFANLVDLSITDYVSKEDFLIQVMVREDFGDIEMIFYEDACSPITEWDGKYMMSNNYQCSKELLYYCLECEIPSLYAFSTVTYGDRTFDFIESREYEKSLNVYGHSKFLFDEYVCQILLEANLQIIGFRYSSVYGPREGHKGSMVSVAFHLNTQLNNDEVPRLLEDGENSEHDFVYTDDVAAVNLWLLESGVPSIFNLGTDCTESFQMTVGVTLVYHKKGSIEHIPFPEKLKGRYQASTQADLTNLRAAGYDKPFKTVIRGVMEYMA